MPAVNLDVSDAAELAELLQFPHDWFAADGGQLRGSLSDFAEVTARSCSGTNPTSGWALFMVVSGEAVLDGQELAGAGLFG
jgi:hypothetical protein